MGAPLRDLPPPPSYRLPWRDRLPGPLRGLVAFPWWTIALSGVLAVLLAQQILAPNSRIIKAVAGLLLLLIAARSRPSWTLCFITLLFPFPFSIFVGPSTMIFIVLATLIHLARLTLRQVEPLRGTPVDIGLGLLVTCYILSFYNVDNPVMLSKGIVNLIAILASFLLYYMTANFIRTEKQLRTFINVLAITYLLCGFVALYELFLPGRVLIPHWILDLRTEEAEEYYRVSGPFYDFELFGEFMAMGVFLGFFLYRRGRSPNARFFAAGLAMLCLFVLFTTVTRGATLAFLGAAVYLGWLLRKRLKARDLSAILLVGVAGTALMEFLVSTFTRSGSVVARILGTEFVGLTPDSRSHWPKIWERVLEHPLVGHGPYYDLGLSHSIAGTGLYTHLWPHNQYLYYAHTVGLLGLAAFLFIGLRLAWVSLRERAQTLQDPSYARSLMVVLHVMLVLFLVDQIKIEHLRNTTYQYFPWLLMGLIAACHHIIRGESPRPATPHRPPGSPWSG